MRRLALIHVAACLAAVPILFGAGDLLREIWTLLEEEVWRRSGSEVVPPAPGDWLKSLAVHALIFGPILIAVLPPFLLLPRTVLVVTGRPFAMAAVVAGYFHACGLFLSLLLALMFTLGAFMAGFSSAWSALALVIADLTGLVFLVLHGAALDEKRGTGSVQSSPETLRGVKGSLQ